MAKAKKEIEKPKKPRKTFTEEYANLAGMMAIDGASNAEIAEALDISEATFAAWLKYYEPLRQVISLSREIAAEMLEASLFKMAVGYYVTETKWFNCNGILRSRDIQKFYPPSQSAAAFLLTAYDPGKWGKGADGSGGTFTFNLAYVPKSMREKKLEAPKGNTNEDNELS